MAEIIEENDMTTNGADAWQVWYRVRRDDGEEVSVQATCTGTAEATAQAEEDREALSFIADRGQRAALHYAELAQSPAKRGNVIVRVMVDPHSGGLAHDYDYERSL